MLVASHQSAMAITGIGADGFCFVQKVTRACGVQKAASEAWQDQQAAFSFCDYLVMIEGRCMRVCERGYLYCSRLD